MIRKEKDFDDIRPINPIETFHIMQEGKNFLGKVGEFDKKRVMVSGVYLMSTEDIQKYFFNYEFTVRKIFWLNDFSCLVEFDNEDIAIKALWKLTESKYDNKKSEMDNFDWKKGRKYIKFNKEIDILLRLARVGDINRKNEKKEKKVKKNSIYNNNKKKKRDRSRSKDSLND